MKLDYLLVSSHSPPPKRYIKNQLLSCFNSYSFMSYYYDVNGKIKISEKDLNPSKAKRKPRY